MLNKVRFLSILVPKVLQSLIFFSSYYDKNRALDASSNDDILVGEFLDAVQKPLRAIFVGFPSKQFSLCVLVVFR